MGLAVACRRQRGRAMRRGHGRDAHARCFDGHAGRTAEASPVRIVRAEGWRVLHECGRRSGRLGHDRAGRRQQRLPPLDRPRRHLRRRAIGTCSRWTSMRIASVAYHPTRPGVLYGVSGNRGENGGVARSLDDGLTWEVISTEPHFAGQDNSSIADLPEHPRSTGSLIAIRRGHPLGRDVRPGRHALDRRRYELGGHRPAGSLHPHARWGIRSTRTSSTSAPGRTACTSPTRPARTA